MPKKNIYRTTANYNSWLNNAHPTALPGYSKYKEAPNTPESRVQSFLEGTPSFKEVRRAHYSGKITTDEAKDLRPNDTFPSTVGKYVDKSDEATHRRARLKGE
jgi:hypothetical protein